jgi:hypothetical protein
MIKINQIFILTEKLGHISIKNVIDFNRMKLQKVGKNNGKHPGGC